jgi:AcrR family transcriptional regulator
MAEGLRERKKRERRKAISDIAMRLFAERGFDAVTVAQVARAADVSAQTVFNYFRTKEDLVFDEDEERELTLVEAVRDRAPGESIVAPMRRRTQAFLDRMERVPFTPMGTMPSIIMSSNALIRRALEMYDRHVAALAAELAREAGMRPDDVTARAVATQLVAVEQSLFRVSGPRFANGTRERVISELRAEVEQAYDVLELGLRGYPPTR